MRRLAKRLLSLIFVLAMALGLAVPAAWADDPPETAALTGDEALSFVFSLAAPTEQEPTAAVPISGNALADEKYFTATLGGESVIGGALTLKDLMDGELLIAPPEGYRVLKLLLLGSDSAVTEVPLPLLAGSPESKDTAREVSVDPETFERWVENSNDPVFNEAMLSSSGAPFRLSVLFEAYDTGDEAEVTVSTDLGQVIDDIDAETKAYGEKFTVPTLSEEQRSEAEDAGKFFNGWLLSYDNSALAYVDEGDEIYPCGDCTLTARWKTIATVTANAPVKTESGDYVANGFTVSGLRDGHRIDFTDCTLTVSQTDDGCVVTPSDAQVLDEDDDDMTWLYKLRYVASAAVAPEAPSGGGDGGGNRGGGTPITVTATASKVYDGSPLSLDNSRLTVTGGTLPEGYSLEAEFGSNNTITNVGSVEHITISNVKVKNGSGEYVTGDYSVTTVDGTLSVSQKQVDITAVTGSKEYTGQAITAADVTADGFTNGYKAEGLVSGHSLSALTLKINNAVSVTAVGSYVTSASGAAVTDGSGNVTANYSFVYHDGAVSVTTRTLTVTAVSGSKEYSGQAVTAADVSAEGFSNGFKVEGLASGHSLSAITVTVNGGESVTNVGSYTTAIASPSAIQVSSSGNTDVTGNYNIVAVDGTLAITKKALTVTAISGTLTATGDMIYAKNCDGNDYIKGYKQNGLISGHTLSGDFVTGSGSEGEFTTGIDLTKLVVKDTGGNPVTDNYNITAVGGKITVRPQTAEKTPITVTATATKVYDAKPMTLSNSDLKLTSASPNLLPSGYTLEATFANVSITNAQKVSVAISNVKVKDASGADVTDKFAVTVVTGSMEITKKPLTLTAESASKTYDGKALVNKNVRSSALASSDHKLSVEYEITNSEGKVIKTGAVNVGTYTKKITKATIMEGSTDVTANYNITTVDGTLTITAGSTSKTSSKPATGDTNRLNLWVGILVLSAILALSLLLVILLRHRLIRRGPKPKTQRKK